MALNEDALESLIQGGDRRHGTQVKVAERTDEFEVYERATPRDIMTDTLQAAEAAAQAAAPPEADQAPPAPTPQAEPTVPQQTPEPTVPQQAPPEPVAPQQAPETTAPQPAPEPTVPQQAPPEPAAPQPGPEPAAPAPLEPAEPVAQEPARPAAPMLRFPGTTGKPPNLGLATDAPHTPHAPPPAPEAPPATEPWTQGPAATGADVQVALVQADFNPGITDEMARLATERARALGATVVQHVHVAGAFDLPLTVQTLAQRDGIEAVVALGCVIQGETGHDLTITDAAARQLARIACDTGTPIGFGVIGPRMTKEQAEARVQVGANAMESAVRQVRTLRAIADPAQVDATQYAAQGH